MKTIEHWIHKYEMETETVPQLIAAIQRDALMGAAEIAERQAVGDDNAANATTDLDTRLTYLAQKESALAVQKTILLTAQASNDEVSHGGDNER